MIIRSQEDLRNPLVCYISIRNYMVQVGEDFIDQNESIVRSVPFILWMCGKGYISNEVAEKMIDETDCIQQLLSGYEEGLFPKYGECGSLAPMKGYSLLAEYLSILTDFRNRLYEILKDENLLEFDDRELEPMKQLTKEFVINYNNSWFIDDSTHRDMWDLLQTLTVDECDVN